MYFLPESCKICIFCQDLARVVIVFNQGYDEFKSLCREAWRKKYNYLLINTLEDKNKNKYKICSESNPVFKVFNPQTEPF